MPRRIRQRLECGRKPEINRHARMKRPGNVPDFLNRGAQQLAHFRYSWGGAMIADLISNGRDLETRCCQRLANRFVEISRNARALVLLRVNHLRAELAHALATRGKSVEHVVDISRE